LAGRGCLVLGNGGDRHDADFSPTTIIGVMQPQRGTKKGHPIGVALFCVAVWWSRRESNPRPSAIHLQIYMLSHVY